MSTPATTENLSTATARLPEELKRRAGAAAKLAGISTDRWLGDAASLRLDGKTIFEKSPPQDQPAAGE